MSIHPVTKVQGLTPVASQSPDLQNDPSILVPLPLPRSGALSPHSSSHSVQFPAHHHVAFLLSHLGRVCGRVEGLRWLGSRLEGSGSGAHDFFPSLFQDRLRDTLIHEICHAASWLLDGIRDSHGDAWKYYAKKSNMVHPELPMVTRCHNYKINYRIHYECTRCKTR